MKWLFLVIAIMSEVVATSALKSSDGFTKLLPSAIVILGYGSSFYFMSITLKFLPIGIVYAVWSGLGIVLITLVGHFFFKQHLDIPSLTGIGFIMTGIAIMNLFSKSVVH